MPRTTLLVSALFGAGFASADVTPCNSVGWTFQGPTTYVTRNDDTEMASAGAAQDIVQGSNNTWFLGSVNGGVWRTKSLGREKPHWENVLDGQPVTCSSISALHVSSLHPTTVYAGCGGSTSSEQGHDWNVMNSGDWAGIMVSRNNGDTWEMISGFPSNYYVTDILETGTETLLVSAQSHLYDRNEGGIWRTSDDGKTFTKVDDSPTFTLTELPKNAGGGILATHTRSIEHSISLSTDGGKTFSDFGRLPWNTGATPFYTCAAPLSDGRLVVAGMTRSAGLPNNTDSQFFVRQSPGDGDDNELATWVPLDQPTSMDEDSMPKDRMAILGDPDIPDLMYVAGNAGALAWRVNVTSAKWTKMWDKPDVADGSMPHGDCRNYAWDAADDNARLILVSDGGAFARIQPREPGGKWVSLNGDYASMELLSARYDPRDNRFVAGAQDNCAQVTPVNSTSADVAIGFVEGDGTVTLVDSAANPSRLFGTTQFLGVGTIDIDPTEDVVVNDDDDDCGGLCFVQGDKFIEVPVDKYIPEPSSFPFFVHQYSLNTQDPTRLVFWTNGTSKRPSAFYEFSIPYTVKDKDDIKEPTLVAETPAGVDVLDFISGSTSDSSLLVAISNTHLYVRAGNTSATDASSWEGHPLPASFAYPVVLQYDPSTGARILGPVTHGRTVNMAVSPSDPRVISVTGWPSIDSNTGNEVVFVTSDAGKTWKNVTGNMRKAAGVVGKVRPGGMELVDLAKNNNTRALVLGTSNGVLVTFLSATTDADNKEQEWTRLGSSADFPIVLTADVDYEPYSDTLVAATFGRGIYSLPNAKQALLDARDCIAGETLPRVPEESSAKWFAPQL